MRPEQLNRYPLALKDAYEDEPDGGLPGFDAFLALVVWGIVIFIGCKIVQYGMVSQMWNALAG
jgi:hypothetical protein